jgi:hypothetical protein
MGIIWCVCEKIQDFSSDTYSLERGGHAEIYHWLEKYYIVNGEFGVVYHRSFTILRA